MQKIMFDDACGLTRMVADGTKTVTRRGVMVPAAWQGKKVSGLRPVNGPGAAFLVLGEDGGVIGRIAPRYKVGEVVAVAERYGVLHERLKGAIREKRKDSALEAFHRAGICDTDAGWDNKMYVRARLMPLRIRITGIRAECLQDISDGDCLREGVRKVQDHYFTVGDYAVGKGRGFMRTSLFPTPRKAFAALIDKTSGSDTWDRNPFVFVYEFEIPRNPETSQTCSNPS